MKTNQTISHAYDPISKIITFTVIGHPLIKLHMTKVHPEIVERLAAVGAAQVRVIDAAAIGRTDREGRIIPEAERTALKVANMRAIIEHLESGTNQWERKARKAGPVEDSIGLVREAIANVLGCGFVDVEDKLAALVASRKLPDGSPMYPTTDVAARSLAKSEKVAAEILRLKAAAITPAADADGLLADLMGAGGPGAEEQGASSAGE